MLRTAFLMLALAACADGGPEVDAQGPTLAWDLNRLDDLGQDYVYEGWVIVDGQPLSTGRFQGGEATIAGSITLEAETADLATAFVLTIEPAVGDDPGPSGTKLLAGPIGGGATELSVGDPAALGDDFTSAAGGYILATPTSASDEDEQQGIWFLDPSSPEGPSASLDLPILPDGWVYEGWVAGPDGPISTGRFTAVEGADDDGPGPEAGPNAGPPFPGQDFITPPLDLVGLTAVISVEPEPDNSAAPFTLKPLVHEIGAATHALQVLENNALETNPSGSVWFE